MKYTGPDCGTPLKYNIKEGQNLAGAVMPENWEGLYLVSKENK